VAKAITKNLPPVAPVLRIVVRELVGENGNSELDTAVLEERFEEAVKEAVKEAVRDAVEAVVEQNVEQNGAATANH
jgi:histone H3/H4